MSLKKIRKLYLHIQTKSKMKQFGYYSFFVILMFYSYVAYQIMYKPWLPTEFVRMEHIADNDNGLYHRYNHYVVKNPPYSFHKRLEMIAKHMESDFVLVSSNNDLLITSDYSQEGWEFRFPFVRYIDRNFKPYPKTGCIFGCDGRVVSFSHVAGTTIARAEQLRSVNEDWKCVLRRRISLSPPELYLPWLSSIYKKDEGMTGYGVNINKEEIYPSPECLGQGA